MKILHIRFRNLNSLTGEWALDFTHPAYAGDGLFAITGPTGAGKTTLLDALCLALYGQTPRLGKISKGGNEIMSRRTGDCFAEVTFETPAGRFRCTWSQHRARKKPEGELQHPKHEIVNADTGAVLEAKIRDVADRIEAATGMNFDRFTRSMLLAQGNFAAFLKAEPDERAPILEQITGTEIYSDISIRVHERQRAERAKLDQLRAETSGVTVLDAEQEQSLRQSLEEAKQQEVARNTKTRETAQALTWLDTLDTLRKELASLDEAALILRQERDAFQPDREKLLRAHQAASLDGLYATLVATRRQQDDDTIALKAATEALPAREAAVTQHAEAHRRAEQNLLKVKDEANAVTPVWLKVRALDQQRTTLEKAVADGEAACRAENGEIAKAHKQRTEARTRHTEAAKALDDVNAFLTDNARDEWLVGGLAGVEEQVGTLLARQGEIRRNEEARKRALGHLKQAEQALTEARAQTARHRQAVEAAAHQRQQAQEALARLLDGRLLRELRTQHENRLREMALLAKIAELEDHRARLQDGAPCPLCGATEHPYAAGNLPSPDVTEQKVEALSRLIAQAEEQETAIKALEVAEQEARNAFIEAEKREAAAGHAVQTAGKAVTDGDENLETLRTGCGELRRAVAERLQPWGLAFSVGNEDAPVDVTAEASSLLEALKTRRDRWQAQMRTQTALAKQLADIEADGTRLDAVLETRNQALAGKRVHLEEVTRELATVRAARTQLYGEQNVDDEERRLNEAIRNADEAEKTARKALEEVRQQGHAAKTRVDSLQQAIDQRTPVLRQQEADFTAALTPLGFSGEADVLAARLPVAAREHLAAVAKQLDDRAVALNARRNELASRLQTETARALTDAPREELARRLRDDEEALQEIRRTVAALTYQLDENAAALERIRDKQAALDAQTRECRRWDALHELIGSADGKKYRNFAQGLTFELMVGDANRQLQAMNDRYLLVRDRTRPLDLNVIDNYQAGEIRSTKNLSGGESFLVSLALALGLSRMSSRNVRVDSLFLDEGFGTLDEDALDTALETLAGLRQEGKLIGVISHVESLKERIATQIRITPLTGGRSALAGPGVTQVAAH